ncbi:MAG: M90 family metallopeptidase [Ilumatobacteraceae bacterium]
MRWRRRAARAMPAGVESLYARHVAEWAFLDPDERARVIEAAATLVGDWRWEAANRFDLTDEMCAVIAGQAGWMALGLGLDDLAAIGTIVVHPTTMTSVGSRPGPVDGLLSDEPVHLHGEAYHHGPLLLAWDAVRRDTRRFGNGLNVVVHEITHKLDMLDGIVDGTPPLPDDQRARWIEVCTAEFKALRDGTDDGTLRDYAATDTGEFFATAAEAFFDRPALLAEHKPSLYGVLRDYFGADPAARRRRGAWQDRACAQPSP